MKIEREPCFVALIVAENLSKLREFQGITQAEMAERIYTNQPGYCLSENGERELNLLNLYYLAVEFGIDLNSLFGLSDNRINPSARIKHDENLKKIDRRRNLWIKNRKQ